jgi:hypothetical protein
MTRANDLLSHGTHGHVRTLHENGGQEVWSTSLPKTGCDVVTLLYEDGLLDSLGVFLPHDRRGVGNDSRGRVVLQGSA